MATGYRPSRAPIGATVEGSGAVDADIDDARLLAHYREVIAMPKGEAKLIGIPIEVLAAPRDGEVLTERWWVVHDDRALFWRSAGYLGWAPQCNRDIRVATMLAKKLYPGAEVRQVSTAFVGSFDAVHGYLLTKDLLEQSSPAPEAKERT